MFDLEKNKVDVPRNDVFEGFILLELWQIISRKSRGLCVLNDLNIKWLCVKMTILIWQLNNVNNC